MPTRTTIRRAKEDLRAGNRPSTAAGEFVREEIEHIRRGKHGARSSQQAIAIGLSKARRAGVPLEPPAKGQTKDTRKSAERDYDVGRGKRKARSSSTRRKKASTRALKRESRSAASRRSLSTQAKRAAARRRRPTTKAATRRATRR